MWRSLPGGAAALLIVSAHHAVCQTQPRLPFEVATVKVSQASDPRGSIDFEKGGRFVARNVPLKELIAEAYHVRPEALSDAPGWTASERFDIVAKAPPATSPDDLRRMMVALLEERFKLAAHTARKVGPAYALVAGRKGPALKESADARAVDGGCRRRRATTPGDLAVVCQHMSMADLADALPDMAAGYIQVPVVDQTGVGGFYDFDLSWTPAGLFDGSNTRRRGDNSGSAPPAGSGTTVFNALEDQVGLKLQSRKLPLPMVVIDHVERASTEH